MASPELRAAGENASYEVISLDLASLLVSVCHVATAIKRRTSAKTPPPLSRIRALMLNAAFTQFGTQTWAAEGGGRGLAASSTWPSCPAIWDLGHWLAHRHAARESMGLEKGGGSPSSGRKP
ncbi:hypothetical protein F4778DRAFT_782424 [Xylariomycetidae sp. FL2044]|nr:hypothetical protein F4778DRAFT_782424 [Xylariomycetidae sp. FL2044]